jgi:hypothetical protein
METYEIDRELCLISGQALKNGSGFDFERQTVEEIADTVEGLGPAHEKNGVMERHFFGMSAYSYNLKIFEAKVRYERDLKEAKPIKTTVIDNEVAFIVRGPKKN